MNHIHFTWCVNHESLLVSVRQSRGFILCWTCFTTVSLPSCCLARSIKQSYLRRQPNEAEPVNHVEGGRINVLLAELARRTWSFTLFFGRFRVHQEWVKVWTISGASDSHISESPQKPMRFQSAFPNWRCRLTSRFPPFNTQFDHSKSKERDWHWAWVPAPTVRHGTISVVLLTTPLLAPGILWKNSEYLNSIYYY